MTIYLWQFPNGRWYKGISPTGNIMLTETTSGAHIFGGDELQELREMWEKHGGKVFHAVLGEHTL